MAIDREAARRAIADFLRALGHDPDRDPELSATPERVVEAYANELLAGYSIDLDAIFAESSPNPGNGKNIVALTGIAVTAVCPHHLLPALGSASVAYQPGERVLGLGALARIVDAFARRLTLQEQIGENVVQSLCQRGGALGAFCAIELVHGCLSARGPCQSQARVVTVAREGTLAAPDSDAGLALALGRGFEKGTQA